MKKKKTVRSTLKDKRQVEQRASREARPLNETRREKRRKKKIKARTI